MLICHLSSDFPRVPIGYGTNSDTDTDIWMDTDTAYSRRCQQCPALPANFFSFQSKKLDFVYRCTHETWFEKYVDFFETPPSLFTRIRLYRESSTPRDVVIEYVLVRYLYYTHFFLPPHDDTCRAAPPSARRGRDRARRPSYAVCVSDARPPLLRVERAETDRATEARGGSWAAIIFVYKSQNIKKPENL